MRNLLALGAAAFLLFAGLGWYLGWYRLQSSTTQPGHQKIQIDVDSTKIHNDIQKGREKLRDILTKDGASDSSTPTPTPPSVPTIFTTGDDGSIFYPADAPPILPPPPLPPILPPPPPFPQP